MSLHQCLSSALIVMFGSGIVLAATDMQTVTQQGRAFSAKTLQIVHGGLVRFNNIDTFIHQIYVESPSFNYESDEQPPGETVDITFAKAGAFEVRCHIHPKMLLRIDVQ